jgi:ATP-dependent exoDNAse (exonuclease V) alpha subunit
MMIARRRADVADLNRRARAAMAAAGRLGPSALAVAGRDFAVGDRIITMRNALGWLGIASGTIGTVTAVDLATRSLTMQTDDGRAVRLPAAYLQPTGRQPAPRVDHAYAITGHKAQGMTTDHAFILGGDDLDREWGYVALSRGRDGNRLYAAVPEHAWAKELDLPPAPARDPLTVALVALDRTSAEPLATDQQPSAAGQDHMRVGPIHSSAITLGPGDLAEPGQAGGVDLDLPA